eukprot:Protomagalhaensia_wolfi_Nauph_80__334@NODE_1186_length_1669_cov_173_673620_g910_i0_p1_GENE_NODE_1186_length_1669_cov_173_673620_g910_i0NODE_1186_length_1669_cov_173_673620_g910_i0_p1_ORF_typecomplete_len238_score33_86DUF3824/PF12868_7/4_7DUF3824/PF12868_7/1_9e02_NODE_1186_length_1669_cov_173_673620_g910_i043714
MAASFAPSRVYLIENGEKQMLEQHNFEGAAYRRGIEIQLGRIPNAGFREAIRRRITGETNKEKFASLRSLLDSERPRMGDRIKWPDILVEKVQNYVPMNPQKAQKRKDRDPDESRSYRSSAKRHRGAAQDELFSDDSENDSPGSAIDGDFAILTKLRGTASRRRRERQAMDLMMRQPAVMEYYDNAYMRDAHAFRQPRKEPIIYHYDMYGLPPDGLRFFRRTW